ncbi:MAG: insulinase family protein [Anaerolineales bacterium]|nr:insulinase family protein [Anaerolineales bacterium]MBP6209143.1 insulinase family protein [Anaerolineales bacterium]MBP8164944.1 insulinase family protein [Anaerolineales bacterium]
MANKITQTTLKNGMKVMLKEIHTAPIISSWVWYRVGSRDEPTGKTGISHWTEHMQFKGTKQFPASMLDKAISREGGRWNASTSHDSTRYFETMPADKIDLALRLESDRMQNSLFDAKEVASERTVIISEREGHENEPMFRVSEAVQQTAFHVHPYHHEIIGDMADLRTITRDDLYDHYRKYYVPNNAVLSMAGDFDTKSMLKRIKELFEPIPKGKVPPRLIRPEPEPKGEVRLSVEGPGETTFIQVAYRFPNATDPDYIPLQVFDSLLAGASGLSYKTSRLYRALVDKEFAVDVSGWSEATIDPYLYRITITKHPKRQPEEVLAALDKEITKLQDVLVSSSEITRAVKQARAVFAYGSENITNQAFWMGYVEMFSSYEWFTDYLNKLAKVTPADVRRVARKYFQPSSRVIGTYVPKGKEA